MNLGIKLLVAEDDPNLGTILKAYLTQKGYTVVWAKDGEEALNSFDNEDVDACILDVMMPLVDGLTVAKDIRKVDKNVPIIFLTAKNLEEDKLKGFEVGADDYITKPFSMEELLARLNATMRRSFNDERPDKNIFRIGNFTFDYTHQTLTIGENTQRLTAKECDLTVPPRCRRYGRTTATLPRARWMCISPSCASTSRPTRRLRLSMYTVWDSN